MRFGKRNADSAVKAASRFIRTLPSQQNALDIFSGAWACDFSTVAPGLVAGDAELFTSDPRPKLAATHLGVNGRLDGMEILELGPLEAAHSYQLSALGARGITAIEANSDAYLKCLVVKEILGLERVKFLLGDFCEFLRANQKQYDLIFCSGVLYHMSDPLELIKLIASATSKVLVWTHYVKDQYRPRATCRTVTLDGMTAEYYEKRYQDSRTARFWGGNRGGSAWLERDTILQAFRHFGFDSIEVVGEDPAHETQPHITFVARRTDDR